MLYDEHVYCYRSTLLLPRKACLSGSCWHQFPLVAGIPLLFTLLWHTDTQVINKFLPTSRSCSVLEGQLTAKDTELADVRIQLSAAKGALMQQLEQLEEATNDGDLGTVVVFDQPVALESGIELHVS
jgi:hypothetical protein